MTPSGKIDIFDLIRNGDIALLKRAVEDDSGLLRHRTKSRLTPLHLAAFTHGLDALEFLLSKDADVSAADDTGKTPLIYAACAAGGSETAKLLLAGGAAVNQGDNLKVSALHAAALIGDAATVKTLLAANAKVDIKNAPGETPLHCAASKGHAAVVQLLLEHGANAAARTNRGSSPMDFASEGNHHEVMELLRPHHDQMVLRHRKRFRVLLRVMGGCFLSLLIAGVVADFLDNRVDSLIARLDSSNPQVRHNIAGRLGDKRDPGAVEPLIPNSEVER
ncbi:MAG TPA: ankyrin repeat domain-containing protein [Verrucomicrobiae bacterium]|jgi:ankyrin repeat protein